VKFLKKLAAKSKPVAKKLAIDRLKTKLEPHLQKQGLTWSDVVPMLEKVGIAELHDAASDPETFFEELAERESDKDGMEDDGASDENGNPESGVGDSNSVLLPTFAGPYFCQTLNKGKKNESKLFIQANNGAFITSLADLTLARIRDSHGVVMTKTQVQWAEWAKHNVTEAKPDIGALKVETATAEWKYMNLKVETTQPESRIEMGFEQYLETLTHVSPPHSAWLLTTYGSPITPTTPSHLTTLNGTSGFGLAEWKRRIRDKHDSEIKSKAEEYWEKVMTPICKKVGEVYDTTFADSRHRGHTLVDAHDSRSAKTDEHAISKTQKYIAHMLAEKTCCGISWEEKVERYRQILDLPSLVGVVTKPKNLLPVVTSNNQKNEGLLAKRRAAMATGNKLMQDAEREKAAVEEKKAEAEARERRIQALAETFRATPPAPPGCWDLCVSSLTESPYIDTETQEALKLSKMPSSAPPGQKMNRVAPSPSHTD
jgi:hypothetical protein